jgi:hypothetical protein
MGQVANTLICSGWFLSVSLTLNVRQNYPSNCGMWVLACLYLPSLIPLASTTPADEHMLASGTLHKLNGSLKAWHRMIVRKHQ